MCNAGSSKRIQSENYIPRGKPKVFTKVKMAKEKIKTEYHRKLLTHRVRNKDATKFYDSVMALFVAICLYTTK